MTATTDRSAAEAFHHLPPNEQQALLATLDDLALQAIADRRCYRWYARRKQLPPEGDWGTWVLRAGRGFGKDFAGSGWVHERAMQEKRWIAIIGKTPADVRDYQIE